MISLFMRIDQDLRGAPDEALTLGLLAAAAVLVGVAIWGDDIAKAAVLVWAVLP